MGWIDDLLDRAALEAKQALDLYRMGYYRATVSIAERSYHRAQIVPTWMPDGAVELVRRIQPAIHDVIEAVGERVAVISEDGVPERSTIMGRIWEQKDAAQRMTVWLRAHLQKHPGHLEIGATKGIKIRVGGNEVTLTPLADGTLELDADVSITLGSGATDPVALSSKVEARLQAIEDYLASHEHTYINASGSPTPTDKTLSAGTNPASVSPDPSAPSTASGDVASGLVTSK